MRFNAAHFYLRAWCEGFGDSGDRVATTLSEGPGHPACRVPDLSVSESGARDTRGADVGGRGHAWIGVLFCASWRAADPKLAAQHVASVRCFCPYRCLSG